MEMEIKADNLSAKEENIRNSIPYVKQLSTDGNKSGYANGDVEVYPPTTQRRYLNTQVCQLICIKHGFICTSFRIVSPKVIYTDILCLQIS